MKDTANSPSQWLPKFDQKTTNNKIERKNERAPQGVRRTLSIEDRRVFKSKVKFEFELESMGIKLYF